ncbi:MAG: rhomboid family intramembrane serine protease [Candidatus Aenigmarchaeota archaeon]|nr:rhomboid family intramembrane serine protease [Candidatus Aenigmarchaeota archaeon]
MRTGEFFPIATFMILLINVSVFIFSFDEISHLFLSFFNPEYYVKPKIYSYGLHPTTLKENPYILVTHMFIHDNWIHLVVNMLLLTSIGMLVEREIGGFNFISLYFFSGFFGVLINLLTRFIFPVPNIVSIGSSGCIFGVLFLGSVLCGEEKVPIIFVPILNLLSPYVYLLGFKLDVNLGLAFMFYIIFSVMLILLKFGNLMELSHFGGILGGLVYFWLLSPKKT